MSNYTKFSIYYRTKASHIEFPQLALIYPVVGDVLLHLPYPVHEYTQHPTKAISSRGVGPLRITAACCMLTLLA